LGSNVCKICTHVDRTRIESLKASGAGIDSLAKKFGVSRDSVHRHWKNHVSADRKAGFLAGEATIAALKERAAAEGGKLVDYLSIMRRLSLRPRQARHSPQRPSPPSCSMCSERWAS
jgi:hypothetical protein